VSSFVTLTWLKALPFWIAAVVISRDLILMVGALVIPWPAAASIRGRRGAGKIATLLQILTRADRAGDALRAGRPPR